MGSGWIDTRTAFFSVHLIELGQMADRALENDYMTTSVKLARNFILERHNYW